MIKTILIKATDAVTNGMIRLFIGDGAGNFSLYKEVVVPATPILADTPDLALQSFEISLNGNLMLNAGFVLSATTQNEETFNVIAFGLDWTYPATLPTTCNNFKQQVATTGFGTVSTANTNLDGSGTIVNLLTAPSSGFNGLTINTVTLKALQSTTNGMIRLFISPDSESWYLLKEVVIPLTTQSATLPSYKQVLDLDLNVANGYAVGAATQNTENFALLVEGTSWSYPIS